ncbi:MAG TPA: hypothetical protein VM840_10305, partial [Actinomycetota bacterium]|nr:hypothetical protein [Actinomycetota bacterium]
MGAEEVTGPQLRELARRAANDPTALARLRSVTAVDGRPVDLGQALEGAEGDDLQARLSTLATDRDGRDGELGGAAPDRAREIVSGPPYT